MSERQNIEWKRSWQDEYLKWICGFANAPHASVPRNRLIADICFKAGYIDSWGHGIEKITNTCTEHGCPTPNFDVAIAEMAKQITPTGVLVILAPKFSMAPQVTQQDGTSQAPVTAPVEQAHEDQVGTKSGLSRHQVEILHKCMETSAIGELMTIAGRSDRTKFRNQVLKPLMEAELVEMTVPDKPSSRFQKYRLSAKGMEAFLNS